MQTLILDVAGMEYVQRVLKLYKSTKYYGDKQVLGRMFLDHSIECGRLLEEVEQAVGVAKLYPAQRAADELKKAMYALKVMLEQGYYSRRRTAPVTSLAEEIETSLQYYTVGPINMGHEEIVKVSGEQTQSIAEKAEEEQNIPKELEGNIQELNSGEKPAESKTSFDPLGFTDDYEG